MKSEMKRLFEDSGQHHLQLDEIPILYEKDSGAILDRIIPHLAVGCSECSSVLQEFQYLRSRWGHWNPAVLVPEAEIAERDVLETLGQDDPFGYLSRTPEVIGWCQSVLLLEMAVAAETPAMALTLSQLALYCSENLGTAYDVTYAFDLQAKVLAHQARVLKALREPRSAAHALRQARLRASQGSGSEDVQEAIQKALPELDPEAPRA